MVAPPTAHAIGRNETQLTAMRSEGAICATERSLSLNGHEHDREGLSVMDEQLRYVVRLRRKNSPAALRESWRS